MNTPESINNKNPITSMTWVASDHHFGHAKIEDYEPSRRIWKDLGFKSLEDMIISNHNGRVKEDDSVLFLGDFSWLDPQSYIHKLNGKKYLILGNHDRKSDVSYKGFEKVFRGQYIDVNHELFRRDSVDTLLSSLIMPYDKSILVFSHYALYHDDLYDHQGAGLIQIRKEKIQALVEAYNTQGKDVISIHGHLHSYLASAKEAKHINACLEHTGFAPVRLKDLIQGLT